MEPQGTRAGSHNGVSSAARTTTPSVPGAGDLVPHAPGIPAPPAGARPFGRRSFVSVIVGWPWASPSTARELLSRGAVVREVERDLVDFQPPASRIASSRNRVSASLNSANELSLNGRASRKPASILAPSAGGESITRSSSVPRASARCRTVFRPEEILPHSRRVTQRPQSSPDRQPIAAHVAPVLPISQADV